MKRRDFLKLAGIGTAAAIVAPQVFAEQPPEVYPESNAGQITLKSLQDAYGQTMFQNHSPYAYYMYIRLAPTSLPVSAGDIVYFKDDRRWGTIAYKRKKATFWGGERYGYGISNLTPGNYGFIQIPALKLEYQI